MNDAPEFQPYGLPHLTVILLTVVLPFVLAGIVRQTKSQRLEKMTIDVLSAVLIFNYIVYLVFIRSSGVLEWRQMLPMQMCDWGMFVVIVAMWTGSQRWFEVAYFWGIGGTLQALLTPNLRFGFPDWRFISFFTSHSGIIVGVVFLMLTRGYRPYPMSLVRVWLWSEFYFVVTFVVDVLTGFNYRFHFQGVVRQGEPHVSEFLSREGRRRRLSDSCRRWARFKNTSDDRRSFAC